MSTSEITPVVLTFNEEDNIARCLAGLHWAERILVLDSGSTDETEFICRSNPRVDWQTRPFDSFAGQWNYARSRVTTAWMLALDADYILPPAFSELLKQMMRDGRLDDPDITAWRIPFVYCLGGHPLRATLLPPRLTLFRPERTVVEVDGHTQLFLTAGGIAAFPRPIHHDDRKPFSRWWANQKKYARLEAVKLSTTPWSELAPQDKIRRATPFAPLAVVVYCLVVNRLLLDFPHGWNYTLQRFLAECLLLYARVPISFSSRPR